MHRPAVRWAFAIAVGAAAALAVACQGSRCCPPPCPSPCPAPAHPAPVAVSPAPPSATPVAPATSPFDAQTARGQAAYGRTCASCHGPAGQGSKDAPTLVGPGALPLTRPGAKLRTGEFRTAGDVARFAVANMPPKGPKPSADDAWAIVAFALKANGVSQTDAVGPANADSIVLHP